MVKRSRPRRLIDRAYAYEAYYVGAIPTGGTMKPEVFLNCEGVDHDQLFSMDISDTIRYLQEVKQEADNKGIKVRLEEDYGRDYFVYFIPNAEITVVFNYVYANGIFLGELVGQTEKEYLVKVPWGELTIKKA